MKTEKLRIAISVIFLSALFISSHVSSQSHAKQTQTAQTLLAANSSVDSAQQLLLQAKALEKQSHFEQALPILQKAKAIDPGSYKIHLELAWTLEGLKQPEKALAEYKAAFELYSKSPPPSSPLTVSDIAQGMAACYGKLGKREEAINWLQKAVAIEPDSERIHYNLGINYQKTNDNQKAIPEFLRALQLKPDYLNALLALGDSYSDIGDNTKALGCFQKAVENFPNSADAHYELAYTYRHAGEPLRAIEEYKKTLKIKPDDTDAMNGVGYALTDLGQKESAVNWFKSCLVANPNASNGMVMSTSLANLWGEIAKTSPRDTPTGPDYYYSATKDGLPRRWPPEKLPIKVYVDSGNGVAGMRDSYARFFIDSLNEWMQASQGRLAYQIVSQANLADITCIWTGNPSEVSSTNSDGELGNTISNSVDRHRGAFELNSANIKILTRTGKTNNSPIDDDCMKATCLHEIAHALGIAGHSPNSHDMMYFKAIPAAKAVLSTRDKATMLRLYEQYPAKFL